MNNKFSKILIKWYGENKRDLPWRETTNPYQIWISEIILQQTRVAQGYDYFLRFIKRFPTLSKLAEADEDEVMKYWQGLGYYSRARNLYAAAKSMNGSFPKTYPEILALKGIGEYTAAAICSFAYNMPYAVVDGNVYRILSRYLGIETPIDSTQGKRLFSTLAEELLDKKDPAIYNQAIMDFGAIQCTPASPDCFSCPLSDTCLAFTRGEVMLFPVKQHKAKTLNRYFNYIYMRMGNYTFIKKRTENDIWRNLFELPLIETPCALSDEEFMALDEFHDMFSTNDNLSIRVVCRNVKHVLSHRVIYANFYEVILPDNSSFLPAYMKVREEDLGQYAVSRLMHIFFEKYL
ncbi:A/G-specific adenine glycosylase [uncultured Bacteroides sp.]|uniref:A/G-specific adenine glycosylase n=1 Tax=uncultured Bacteroides sp. TaxID=162156 RepID=UPI002AA62B81|nr:A/G-specific adenine glycosylase [uncultured Bacteroides sp.]